MNIEIINHLSDTQILIESIALGLIGLLSIGFFALLIALAVSVFRGGK